MTSDYDLYDKPEQSVYDDEENQEPPEPRRDDTYDEWAPSPEKVGDQIQIRNGMGEVIDTLNTSQPQPTLAELHDLMIVLHIDLQRIYDLLYVLTRPVHNQEAYGDKLVARHEDGHVFAPEPAIAPEEPRE